MKALIYKIKTDPFNKLLFTLSLPIMLQYLINSSLNLVDTVMIGALGEAPIAAVGFCNVVYFLLMIAMFGISSGTTVFMAQYWGAGDIANIKRVQGCGLSCAIAIALAFTIAALFFPEYVMRIFTKDPEVISLGVSYIQIVGLSYIATAISLSFTAVLRSIEKVFIPTLASLIALGLNTLLNWILIYGHWGFPALGVKGAAIATLIARLLEAIIMLAIIYKKKFVAASTPKELFSFDWAFAKRVMKTALPILINECLWSLGTSMYSVVYGHMGTNIAAAVNITGTIERMAWILVFGLGGAASIMIGKKIGEGDLDTAYHFGKRFLQYTIGIGIVISLALLALNPHVLKLFQLTPESRHIALTLMNIFAAFFVLRALSYMSCIGILRSGGDAKFCLITDTIGVWVVGVPLAVLMGLVWKLPIFLVFFVVNAEDFLKFIPYIIRFKSKKWIRNLTM